MQFNEKLKKLRSESGITQAELADKVFVSRSAVAKWESGLGLPSDESLNALAEFFGVDKRELLSEPETEQVIITKTAAIGRQKIWIAALAALSCALIVVAAILITMTNSSYEPPKAVVNAQFLIFETEKDMDIKISNYSDMKLSIDRCFSETRMFDFTSRDGDTIALPNMLIMHIGEGNRVSYKQVDMTQIRVFCAENLIKYDKNRRHLIVDTNVGEEVCANLWVDDMNLSIKIRKNAISVEQVEISTETLKIERGGSVKLSSVVYPNDATYQNVTFVIEKILKTDGTICYGETELAFIHDFESGSYLFVTSDIEVGAKIYIYGISDDGMMSDVLEVEVTK